MADVVYGMLYSNVHPVTGDTLQTAAPDEETFLRTVITPIYQVLHKVITILLYCTYFLFWCLASKWNLITFCGKRKPREIEGARQVIQGGEIMMIWMSTFGEFSNGNFYIYASIRWLLPENQQTPTIVFRSKRCFRLKWPMDLNADFFIHTDEVLHARVVYSCFPFCFSFFFLFKCSGKFYFFSYFRSFLFAQKIQFYIFYCHAQFIVFFTVEILLVHGFRES